MNEAFLKYARERRESSAKAVFFNKADISDIIRLKQGKPHAAASQVAAASQRSQRQQRRGGAGEEAEGPAKVFSKRVLKMFQVEKDRDGQDVLCRSVKRSGKDRLCAVVALEELPGVIQAHHERATGFSGLEKLYTHVSAATIQSGTDV